MVRRKTTEQFISDANKVHGVGKFGYSRVKYINNKTKVEIECFNHDFQYFFWQIPSSHLEGKGCRSCAIKEIGERQIKTTEQFISDANKVHGKGRYGYSRAKYINYYTEVEIECFNHDFQHFFWQTPTTHLSGSGCKQCYAESLSKRRSKTTEQFISDANKVHGKGRYGYSRVKYVNSNTKVEIECFNHDFQHFFWQVPSSHLDGRGCGLCGYEVSSESQVKTTEQFISDANKVHGKGTYGYSRAKYVHSNTKVEIECFNHDFQHFFWQTPKTHLRGAGCPKCARESARSSKGARAIESWLQEAGCNYDRETAFDGCKYKNKLSFDFQVFVSDDGFVLIEVDGRQHREPVEWWGGMEVLLEYQKRDSIKDKFCHDNNITLLRLEYDGSDSTSTDRIVAELETFISTFDNQEDSA